MRKYEIELKPTNKDVDWSKIIKLPNHEIFLEDQGLPERIRFYCFPNTTPGLILVKNYFSIQEQVDWIGDSLRDYSQAEYTNLTNLGIFETNLWNNFCVNKNLDSLKKLRWVNLGCKYDWTKREYHGESTTPIPTKVNDKLGRLAKLLGYTTFKAEASLVNYYYSNSVMGSHRDAAEFADDQPVISASFGAQCIFLIGTENREDEPISILLESGDVIVMGGESRMAYHSVARIVPEADPDILQRFENECGSLPEDWEAIRTFLEEGARVNVNIRQVYK